DLRTATLWLAIDDSTEENGCMRFVPGSHAERVLRPHRPLHRDRGENHALVTDVDPARDEIRQVPIARGDVTVHDERVVHGSGGNRSDRRRRAYVLAFRSADTIAEERRRGFTHSHNDSAEVLDETGIRGQSSS
ncbi:MAG: phytanoyl-CoA dioxygenase family protein, partial [Planctomycetota bacterium]|nr:phytanoyl-CoA dioxygenase family protein [Planctomycetota bacterium]